MKVYSCCHNGEDATGCELNSKESKNQAEVQDMSKQDINSKIPAFKNQEMSKNVK